jgi:hypothetical protein
MSAHPAFPPPSTPGVAPPPVPPKCRRRLRSAVIPPSADPRAAGPLRPAAFAFLERCSAAYDPQATMFRSVFASGPVIMNAESARAAILG